MNQVHKELDKMFIKAYVSKCDREGFPLWWSGAEVVFEKCPKKRFLFDLVTFSYCKDPISLILTTRKIDGKLDFSNTPDINAPFIYSRDIGPNVLEDTLELIAKNPSYYIDKELESIYEKQGYKQEEIQSRGLMRLFRRPSISSAKRREIQRDILRGLLLEMLRSLCIDDPSKKPKILSYKPLYFLVIIDLTNKRFYECLGKKSIESRVHERYVFENKDLLETIERTIKLWEGGSVK
jgi:hypothetical protein